MTLNILPNAKTQFISGLGVPYAAGSVYMYVPNSSTFKTTWQDSGSSVANTNPIILDSNGEAQIWGAGAYRQVVYDVNGNLVWDAVTQDPGYSVINSLYGTSLTSVAVGLGAKSFTTQPALAFFPGGFLIISSSASAANFMTGTVTSYNTTTGALVMNITSIGGSGTYADWNISVSGAQGTIGVVASGTAGQLTYYATTGSSVSGNANHTVNAGAMTHGVAASVQGSVILAGSVGGTTTLAAPTTGTGTMTLQAGTDTLVGRATTDTLTNKTFVAPVLGAASATSLSFSSTSGIIGTATNDSAAAGSVGEYIESVVTNASPTSGFSSGAAKNVTSISLTAGDWDVEGTVLTVPIGGTTTTSISAGISTTTNTLPASELRNQNDGNSQAAGFQVSLPLPRIRVSLAAPATVYLVGRFSFAVSTMSAAGFINARRVR